MLDKLELLLKAAAHAQKKGSSFFGLLKDSRIQEDQLQTRCTILYCVGQAAARANKTDLKAKVSSIVPQLRPLENRFHYDIIGNCNCVTLVSLQGDTGGLALFFVDFF